MKDFILKPAVQVAIVLAIGAIIVAAFITRQTSELGSILTVLASTMGMFLYKAGWLHDPVDPPLPPSPPTASASVAEASAPEKSS